LAPAWAATTSVAAVTLREQLCLCLFAPVCAKHLCPTLRPDKRWEKVNCTVAVSFSVKPNVVPTGGLCEWRDAARGSELPSRHLIADCLSAESTGAESGAGLGLVVVNVASKPIVVPSLLLALTR